MANKPSVLIVGGGFAGISVVQGLDDIADVTLVEPRDAFAFNIASLRALVAPEWLPRIFLPYDNLMKNGRVVQDSVREFDGHKAILASGDEATADFVVLTTGTSYPFPAKTDSMGTAEAIGRYRRAHEGLAEANRVLIMGAGAVGLELAGEIAAAWPAKQVILFDIADDILPGGYRPELRTELRRQIADMGIELILGEGLKAMPVIPYGVPQLFSVETESGIHVEADIWFRAFGIAPVTDYMSGDLAEARGKDGYIAVDKYMRVPGFDHVFIAGDIAAGHPNGAGRASRHGDLVAANIRQLVTGDGELTSAPVTSPAIILPLGPEGGAGQRPDQDELLDASAVAEIKGRDMMVALYAEKLGVRD